MRPVAAVLAANEMVIDGPIAELRKAVIRADYSSFVARYATMRDAWYAPDVTVAWMIMAANTGRAFSKLVDFVIECGEYAESVADAFPENDNVGRFAMAALKARNTVIGRQGPDCRSSADFVAYTVERAAHFETAAYAASVDATVGGNRTDELRAQISRLVAADQRLRLRALFPPSSPEDVHEYRTRRLFHQVLLGLPGSAGILREVSDHARRLGFRGVRG